MTILSPYHCTTSNRGTETVCAFYLKEQKNPLKKIRVRIEDPFAHAYRTHFVMARVFRCLSKTLQDPTKKQYDSKSLQREVSRLQVKLELEGI